MSNPFSVKLIDAPPKSEAVLAVCDDGSVWVYSWQTKAWEALPPIPGTPAAKATKIASDAAGEN